MFFSEETYRAVIVAALSPQGYSGGIEPVIKETVDALIVADRSLTNHGNECCKTTPEALQPSSDIGS